MEVVGAGLPVCPACGAQFDRATGKRSAELAKCGACGVTFKVPDAVGRVRKKERRPRGVREETGPGRFSLSIAWYRPLHLFGLIYVCVWAVGVFAVLLSLRTGPDLTVANVLPMMFYLGYGSWLAYRSAALVVNRERITIERGILRSSVGPLPWISGCEIEVRNIRQIFVLENLERGYLYSATRMYHLAAEVPGSPQEITTGFRSVEVLRWVEQRLEEELKLVDRAVAGEYRE